MFIKTLVHSIRVAVNCDNDVRICGRWIAVHFIQAAQDLKLSLCSLFCNYCNTYTQIGVGEVVEHNMFLIGLLTIFPIEIWEHKFSLFTRFLLSNVKT